MSRPVISEQAASGEDLRAIDEVFAEIQAGVSEFDAGRVGARFTANASFTTPAGQRFDGWEAINAHHRRQLANPVEGFRTHIALERVTFPAPDIAVVFVRQNAATAAGDFANAGTWVLVKQDGSWWVQAVHNTNVATTA
ncbi:SgcJ/EcaC family oxidoreductase [Embleya sp. NPDC127516]|uniref:SgcJ/EcaC family oxidoreductase n=1 Tax=Embleya sp. NPDC127516 TaxID=3363990 RepID=UPI0037F68F0E